MKCLSKLSVIITEMDVVVNLNHGETFINLKPRKVNSIFDHYTLLFIVNFFQLIILPFRFSTKEGNTGKIMNLR